MSDNNIDRAYYHENDEHLDFSSTHLEQHDIDHNRPSSIDMSLELERQLNEEHEGEQHSDSEAMNLGGHGEKERPISLDPVILSSIVAGLRGNLAEMTKERDGLVETLTLAHSREAELKEALALVTERCSVLEDEVAGLRRKSQDDDDAINMLRAKVEESRRGLMRLQTESKRMSQISTLQSLDTGRANSFFSNGPPSSSKRMSFTPLTGSGAVRVNPHRRTSSVSEPGYAAFLDASSDSLVVNASPPTRVTSLPEEGEVKGRRASGFFNRAKSSPSPPQLPRQLSPEPPQFDSIAAQLEMLKRERDAARSELQNVKLELSETQEACEASNQCVHALRTFISDHSIGEGSGSSGSASAGSGLKLPPLPTDKDVEKEEPAEPRKSLSGGSGWSLGKLWRVDTSEQRNGSSNAGSVIVSPGGVEHASASSTPTAASSVAPATTGGTQTGGISRKFTGFFSSRASVASGQSQTGAPVAKEVPNPHGYEEPMFNGMGSDGEGEAEDSSVDDESLEPRSPEHEPAQTMVLVRDPSASSVGSSSVLNADASITNVKSNVPVQQPSEVEKQSDV